MAHGPWTVRSEAPMSPPGDASLPPSPWLAASPLSLRGGKQAREGGRLRCPEHHCLLRARVLDLCLRDTVNVLPRTPRLSVTKATSCALPARPRRDPSRAPPPRRPSCTRSDGAGDPPCTRWPPSWLSRGSRSGPRAVPVPGPAPAASLGTQTRRGTLLSGGLWLPRAHVPASRGRFPPGASPGAPPASPQAWHPSPGPPISATPLSGCPSPLLAAARESPPPGEEARRYLMCTWLALSRRCPPSDPSAGLSATVHASALLAML